MKLSQLVRGSARSTRVILMNMDKNWATGVVHAGCARDHDSLMPDFMQGAPEKWARIPCPNEPCSLCGHIRFGYHSPRWGEDDL
jgi:hypothetical protein